MWQEMAETSQFHDQISNPSIAKANRQLIGLDAQLLTRGFNGLDARLYCRIAKGHVLVFFKDC
jgi:hypothetical protein